MAEKNAFVGRRYGETKSALSEVLQTQRMVERMCDLLWTAEPVVVVGYDFEKQTVDVRLKNHPEITSTIKGIPIVHTGGEFRIYRSFKTTTDPSRTDGDVGILLFPRTDSRQAFDHGRLSPPFTTRLHKGLGAIFIPGPLLVNEPDPPFADKTATATNLDKFGPKDTALVHKNSDDTYSSIFFKEGGEVVIRGKKVYMGAIGQAAADMQPAERQGDSASSNVRLG